MRATHSGTCQCCGNFQKLPNGVLSKHGYTVDFGYFNGVCRGSDYKPFEQSCDQVERYIGEAQEAAQRIVERIAEASTTKKMWVQHYVRAERYGQKSTNKWMLVEPITTIMTGQDGYTWPVFQYDVEQADGTMKRFKIESYGTRDLAALVIERNQYYIRLELETSLSRVISYILWQTKRVQNWTPGTLMEVK